MNDQTDNNTPDQVDPIRDAAETLLYGDPEIAGEKLRTAIHFEAARLNQHQANTGRIRAELNRRQEYLKRFKEENPEFMDNVAAVAAGEKFCYHEQLADLRKAGLFDIEKFREKNGRDPSNKEVSQLHLEAAAYGVQGIRPVEDWFDRAAERTEEQVPGARRRKKDIEHNRRRAIKDMQRQRGTSMWGDAIAPDDDQPAPRPQTREGDQPVTADSPAAYTRAQFGFDTDPAVDEALTANRKKGFATIAASRGANIQLSRTAQDRRYPDRRAEG